MTSQAVGNLIAKCTLPLSADGAAAPPAPGGMVNGRMYGLPLAGLKAARVSYACPAGQVLYLTVQLRAWIWSPIMGAWIRWAMMDTSLTTGVAAGVARVLEIFVDDSAQLAFTRQGISMTGTATNPAEQDNLYLTLEGSLRKS